MVLSSRNYYSFLRPKGPKRLNAGTRRSAAVTPPFQIFIANKAGSCGGVLRAIRLAKSARVPILGQVVHNPGVVENLEKAGCPSLNSETSANELVARGIGKVVVTAHGLPENRRQELAAARIEMVDTTCRLIAIPIHQRIPKLEAAGHQVVLIGDPNHAEIIASRSKGQNVIVVNNRAEIDALQLNPNQPVTILSQTTATKVSFWELAQHLQQTKCKAATIIDTRCKPVELTQQGVLDLAGKVDVVLIVGGMNSANTTHLAELARNLNPSTYRIEKPESANIEWFSGKNSLGIGAGTSTPREDVERLVGLLESGIRERFQRLVMVQQIGELPSESDLIPTGTPN